MRKAKTSTQNQSGKRITAFPKTNKEYAAVCAMLRQPDCCFHHITKEHVDMLDSFLFVSQLTSCRRTLIYLMAFFSMYRKDGANLGLNTSIIEGWEELGLLGDFLGDIDWIETQREINKG